jgi:hypothetical protein
VKRSGHKRRRRRAALTLLWQQNRMLQSRCAAYEVQVERLAAQVIELEKLRLEVAELRERLGRNSGNSSQPPSPWPVCTAAR